LEQCKEAGQKLLDESNDQIEQANSKIEELEEQLQNEQEKNSRLVEQIKTTKAPSSGPINQPVASGSRRRL